MSNMRVHQKCVIVMVQVIDIMDTLKMSYSASLNSALGRITHATFVHIIKLVTRRATINLSLDI